MDLIDNKLHQFADNPKKEHTQKSKSIPGKLFGLLSIVYTNTEEPKDGQDIDEDDVLKHMAKILGIRGHLQNELYRLEAMLAENDPELKVCIIILIIIHYGQPYD